MTVNELLSQLLEAREQGCGEETIVVYTKPSTDITEVLELEIRHTPAWDNTIRLWVEEVGG